MYVDGFVLNVPTKNLAAYKKMSKEAGKFWMKYGALSYVECVGDDLKSLGGMRTFPGISKTKPSETVLFSFITYKSKKHRDSVNKKVMKDMGDSGLDCVEGKMPFNPKNMAYGGFKSIVEF